MWQPQEPRGEPSTRWVLTFVGTGHPLQRGHVVVVLPHGEGEDPHLWQSLH